MNTISGKQKQREPHWYETPWGKFKLKLIVLSCSLPFIGRRMLRKYYNLPGVGNATIKKR